MVGKKTESVPEKESEKITPEILESARNKLDKIPEKASPKVTLMYAVQSLKPQILKLKERGYTLNEICTFLGDNKIHIRPGTLRIYLRDKSEKATDNKSDTDSSVSLLQNGNPPQAAPAAKPEMGKIHVRFTEKPVPEVLAAMKAAGQAWKWDAENSVWTGEADPETVRKAVEPVTVEIKEI